MPQYQIDGTVPWLKRVPHRWTGSGQPSGCMTRHRNLKDRSKTGRTQLSFDAIRVCGLTHGLVALQHGAERAADCRERAGEPCEPQVLGGIDRLADHRREHRRIDQDHGHREGDEEHDEIQGGDTEDHRDEGDDVEQQDLLPHARVVRSLPQPMRLDQGEDGHRDRSGREEQQAQVGQAGCDVPHIGRHQRVARGSERGQ